MPSCCAINCNNSTAKGYKIYNLPNGKSDFQRRQVWLSNIKRTDFIPPKRSGLCKDHFDSDQFERKIPGKLKWNAIPTVFNFSVTKVAAVSSRGRLIRPKKPFDPDDTSDNDDTLVDPTVTVTDIELSNLVELENAFPRTGSKSPESTEQESNSKRELNSSSGILRRIGNNDSVNEDDEDDPDEPEPMPRLRKRVKRIDSNDDNFLDDDFQTSSDVSAVTWSEAAINRALNLRFSCGYNGYNVLREQGLPLPSDDTLRRKLETIPFNTGLLTDILQLLHSRVQSLDEQDKKVSLIIDELVIQPSLDYDIRAEKIIGLPTIPENNSSDGNSDARKSVHDEENGEDSNKVPNIFSTHGVVFTLQGLSTFWKQTVAYELIGNTFKPSYFKSLIRDIIRKSYEIGLEVKNVVMDMQNANEDVMNEFGIIFGNILDVSNSIPHPVLSKSKLYFFSSFPGILKSLRNHMINGEDIFLPEDVATKYNLPTIIVSLNHVHSMLSAVEENNLKHAAHLKAHYLSTVHYEKLKEVAAQSLFSRETASALRTMVAQSYLPDGALSTAWFIEQVSIWYDLVTSKLSPVSLSQFSVEKLNASVKILNNFILLILSVNLGNENAARKHVQKEIFISTTSVTMIKNDLLYNGDCLNGYNQNFLENLFSIVRFRNSVPTALEFKNALRLISLSQLLKGSSHGSYTVDPTLNMPISALRHVDVSEAIKLAYSNKNSTDLYLSELRKHTLYNLCVYCVTQYIRFSDSCETCVNFIVRRGHPCDTSPSLSDLVPEHCYSPDSHTFAALEVFNLLQHAEEAVLNLQSSVIKCEEVLPQLTEQTLKASEKILFPDCHAVKEKLLEWYFGVRIYSFLTGTK